MNDDSKVLATFLIVDILHHLVAWRGNSFSRSFLLAQPVVVSPMGEVDAAPTRGGNGLAHGIGDQRINIDEVY
jgi:hypothetical protein